MNNPFFKNKGPFEINNLLKLSNIHNAKLFSKTDICDVKDLNSANDSDLTFFHSKKYEVLASKTNAFFALPQKI